MEGSGRVEWGGGVGLMVEGSGREAGQRVVGMVGQRVG